MLLLLLLLLVLVVLILVRCWCWCWCWRKRLDVTSHPFNNGAPPQWQTVLRQRPEHSTFPPFILYRLQRPMMLPRSLVLPRAPQRQKSQQSA